MCGEQKKECCEHSKKRGKSRSCPFQTIHKDMNTLSQARNKEGAACLWVLSPHVLYVAAGGSDKDHVQRISATANNNHTNTVSFSFLLKELSQNKKQKNRMFPTHAKKRGKGRRRTCTHLSNVVVFSPIKI